MKTRDSIVADQARAWVDSAQNRWRLQVLSKRLTLHKDGTRKEVPTRLRRFIEGVPWAFVKPAIDYLLETAPYSGIIANGVDFETAYRPTLTIWTRDSQTATKNDATYTLTQDLVEFDNKDSYAVGSRASCTEKVLTDYVWDASDVEDIPEPRQGVTYAVAGVNRKEDGTFDYQLVEQIALTQHTPEATTVDDATKTATVEAWENVYTNAEGKYVDHTGALLDVPEPGISEGTATQVTNLRQAPDCTYAFQVVRETTKFQNVRDTSNHTQYQGVHEEAANGMFSPLGIAPEARGGVTQEYSSQLQPDGTYSVQRKVSKERPVIQASVEVRVGNKGRRTTVSHKNQAAPADLTGIELGGSVRNDKTPGGLYDTTITTFDRSIKTLVSDQCTEDAFSHTDVKTVGGTEMPGDDDHVTDSGVDGRVVRRDTSMDEEGAITQTTSVTQEKSVDAAEENWVVTPEGVRHSVTNRGQPLEKAGTPPAFALPNIGKSVSNKMTQGGLYDVTIVEVDKNTQPLDTATSCASTVFDHKDSVSTTDPSGTIDPETHVSDPGEGKYYETTTRLNDSGSVTTTRTTTTEKECESSKSYRKTLRGLTTTVVTRNTATPASIPTSIGETQSHDVTPGGLYNLTVTTVEASGGPESASCRKTVFEERDVKSVVVGGADLNNTHAKSPNFATGTYYDVQATVGTDGLISSQTTEVTEKTVNNATAEYRRTARALVRTVTDANSKFYASDPGYYGHSQSHKVTDSGRYTTTYVTTSPNRDPDVRTYEANVFQTTTGTAYLSKALSAETITPGRGVYGNITERRDDYGIVQKVVTKTTEKEAAASGSYRRTTRGLITTRTTKNTSTRAKDPGVNAVGCSQTEELTPGGLYNTTVTTITPTSRPDSAACAKTLFETTSDQVSIRAGSVDSAPPTRETGTTVRKTSNLDDYGFAKTVTTTTTEHPVLKAEVEYRKVKRGLITRVVDKNIRATATIPTYIGESTSHSYNPGGTTNYTYTKITPSLSPDSAHSEQDYFSSTQDTVQMSRSIVPVRADGGSQGKYQTVDSTTDDYGFVKTVTRTTTENSVEASKVYESTHFEKTETSSSIGDTPAEEPEYFEGKGTLRDTHEFTRGGRRRRTIVKVTPKYRSWEESFTTDYVVGSVFYFRNADAGEKAAEMRKATQYASQLARQYSFTNGRNPTSANFTPTVTLNKYGLFDGSYAVEYRWAVETGGCNVDHTRYHHLASWSYVEKHVTVSPFLVTSGKGDDKTTALGGYTKTSFIRAVNEYVSRGWTQHGILTKTVGPGSSLSISPSTGITHIKRVDADPIVEVEIQKGS